MTHTLPRYSLFWYGAAGSAAAAYALLTFSAPAAEVSAIEISRTTQTVLQATIVALMSLTWLFGAAAGARSMRYAQQVQEEDMRRLFRFLGIGIGCLLAGLVLGVLIGQLRSYYREVESVRQVVTITVNYAYVFLPLIGFWLLYRAAAAYQKVVEQHNRDTLIAALLVTIIAVFWVGLIFTNPTRQVSGTPGTYPSFYISDSLIIATIIVPVLIGWFLGIAAALRLSDLSVKARGYAWHDTLSKLVTGIWLLIFGFTLLFGILTIGTERLLGAGLAGVIAVIYLFLFTILAANWRIASSLKRLEEMEEHSYELEK